MMKMEFPKIIRDMERKKKNKNIGTPLISMVSRDLCDDLGNERKEYTIYLAPKLDGDPFIKSMLLRIQEYISKNYEV